MIAVGAAPGAFSVATHVPEVKFRQLVTVGDPARTVKLWSIPALAVTVPKLYVRQAVFVCQLKVLDVAVALVAVPSATPSGPVTE